MKVRELTNMLWYVCKIKVYNNRFDLENDIPAFSGTNHDTLSYTFVPFLNRTVKSFVIIDDYFCIILK